MVDALNEETPLRLEIRGLEKRFAATVAVAGLDLSVGPGELVGLIGPNGAGKSTTIRIATGQLVADRGSVSIDGFDIAQRPLEARRRIGYVPQEISLYPFLTGREHLEFVAKVRDLEPELAAARIEELLERFRLTPARDRMAREYSEGMARKLSVSLALLPDPGLLVLDESLNGLDPRAAAEVKAEIERRQGEGAGVLLVSHTLDTIERMCSRVVLVDRGRAVATLDRPALDELATSGRTLEEFFLEHTAE